MILGLYVCLDKISDEFENWSCWLKTRSNLRKTLCTLERPHFQSDTHETYKKLKSLFITKKQHVYTGPK